MPGVLGKGPGDTPRGDCLRAFLGIRKLYYKETKTNSMEIHVICVVS